VIRISENEYATVRSILKKHIPNCEVRAFGSRYKQTSKEHSDLDLAVVGDQKIPASIIDDLREDFQNSDLPWRVDVLDYRAVSNEFQKVIDAGYEVLE